MRYIILVIGLVSFNITPIFAQLELGGGVNNSSKPSSTNNMSNTGPYSQKLECLNLIKYRLSLNPDESKAPNESPAIFSGIKDDVFGIYVVKPHLVTFTPVTLVSNPPYSPGYHFAYTYPDGRKRLYHFYDDEGDGRGDVAGSGAAPGFQERNPGTKFEPIGQASNRLPRAESDSALSKEAVASLNNITTHLPRHIEYINSRFREMIVKKEIMKRMTPEEKKRIEKNEKERRTEKEGRIAKEKAEVQEALCSCMKTNDPQIVEATKNVAVQLNKKLNLNTSCSPLISFKTNYFNLFLSMIINPSYASEKKVSQKNFKTTLSFTEQLNGVIAKKNSFLLCGASKSWLVQSNNGTILKVGKKCPKNILKKTKDQLITSDFKINVEDKNFIFIKN